MSMNECVFLISPKCMHTTTKNSVENIVIAFMYEQEKIINEREEEKNTQKF